ncbi:MAG: T9SS type A sorting domain-containing protein [Candidatus Eisenbacteria bacterium]|nr:T9SS type A sorting domain-containing protein [Candidatus Eisenbacteria bacterium]
MSSVSDPVVAGTSSDVVVEVRDRFGNRVPDYDGTIEFSSSDGNPETVLPPDYTFVLPDSGRHVFPLSVKLTLSGEQSVSAFDVSEPSVTGTQSGITVVPQDCDSLIVTASSMAVAAGDWLDLEVEAKDEYGNRATGYTGVVGFASSDTGSATVLPVDYGFAPTDAGLHVFSAGVRLTTVGTHTISAGDTSDAQIDGIVSGIQVGPGSPSVLVVVPDSLFLEAGTQGTFTLTIKDSFGNVSPASLPQTLYLWTNSASGEFRETGGSVEIFEKVMAADSSQISFDYVDTRPVESQLTVMDVDTNAPALPAATAQVSIHYSVEDTLIVSSVSDPVVAGTSSDVVVEVRDRFGNRVPDYDGTIAFSSSDGNPETVLPPDYTFVLPDSGRHVFPLSVKLTLSGEQSVSAFDVSEPSVTGTQSGITVVPESCDSLIVRASSMSVAAGDWLDLEVEAKDEYGNRATGYTGVVGFASSDTGSATVLPVDYGFAPTDAGLHVFSAGVRLTTVGTHTISAGDTSDAQIDGFVEGIEVTAGAAASIELYPPGAFYVNAAGTQVISATVRDAFGGSCPGELVSVVIKDAADGSLDDDPANSNNTSGGVSIQTGATDNSGLVTVLYRAPQASALGDTIDAYCSTVNHQSVSDIFVTSTPAGATSLEILPAQAVMDTAGAVLSLSVDAKDSFGNLDTSDTSLVRIRASSPSARISTDGGSAWSATAEDSLRLVSGSSQSRLKLTDTTAGNLGLLAEDVQGILISASKSNITVTPALPAGTITVASLEDTLTANGEVSTIVSAGPLADGYGNNVGSGVKVTVAASLCQIVAPDADTSVSGIQLSTSADGKVSFALRAGTVAGSDTVRAASIEGTASGLKTIVLLDSPYLRYVAGSVSPGVVNDGQKVSFELELENTGGGRVYLSPSSTFGFNDGNDGSYVATLSDTVVVLAGTRARLAFDSVSVPDQLDPGSYSPILSLSGRDGRGNSFLQGLQAGANTVNVVAMRVRTISARSSVTRGDLDTELEMTVENEGSIPLQVTAIGLTFSSVGHSYSLSSPVLPHILAGGETRVFSFLVDVDEYAPLGPCTIDGFASGVSGGVDVNGTHADSTATWLVQSRAALSYVDESLTRASVSLGQAHSFSMAIANSGTVSVELDTSLTYMRFGAPGSEYVARLSTPTLLSGAGETVVHFAEAQVPASMEIGAHSVEVVLAGTENQAAFADTLSCDPQTVRVELPTVLEYVSISPETVSTGHSPSFNVVLANRGEAAARILPGTSLRFGTTPKFEAFFSESLLVESESLRTLTFPASEIDTSFATGPYNPELLVKIEENGIAEDSLITPGSSIVVQKRALLSWVASSLAPSRVTAGQVVGFSLEIENLGDAAALVEPTLCEIDIRDGAHEFVAAGLGAPVLIAPRESAVLQFVQDTLSPAMAAQSYGVELNLEGVENGFPLEARILSPQGELVVQSESSLRYVYDSLTPDVVAQEQTVSFSLRVENTGDATLFVADSSFLSLGTIIDTVDCSQGCDVPGHSTASLHFRSITLDSTAIAAGPHAVSLEFEGTDGNGFLFSQTLSTSPDSVLVNRPGDLRIYSTALDSPNAPRVNTSQAFVVDVEVENVGQEDALDVVVSLSSNGGSVIGGPVTAGVVQGESRKTLSIPVEAGTSGGAETFTAQIESSVGAISGKPLFVGVALDDTTSAIIELPALLSLSTSISEPSGATDNILSTQQNFKIRAIVANTGEGSVASGGTLGIAVPQGFNLLSPLVQSFEPGVAVEWSLVAPADPSDSEGFLVTMANVPLAINTGQAADTLNASRVFDASVVVKTNLSLQSAITAPADATDGSLHVSSRFTIVATVSNLGTAAPAASGKIAISLPAGYALAEGYTQEQDFSVGVPVRWDAIAPSETSPIQSISTYISVIPLDENTGAEAYVSTGTKDIAAYVEAKSMIADVPPLVEAPAQMAPGESSVWLMALRITNPQEIGEGSDIVLKALSFFVDGEDYARLANPSSVLSAVKLSRYSSPGILLGIASVSSTNPVRVELAPEADTLGPGESDTLLVMVDVSQYPGGTGLVLELEGDAAFEVVDVASGQAIGVVSSDNETFPRTFSAPSRWFTGVHNYPNPFRAGMESTRISYNLERDSKVTIRIYTLDGKPVFAKTFSEQESEGREGLREILWDGKNGSGDVVLNGVYICKLEAAGVNATFKIAVAK